MKNDVINYVICQLGLLVNLYLRLVDSAWLFDPFHVTGLFLYPQHPLPGKHMKTSDFLIFSEGIERNQLHEMD